MNHGVLFGTSHSMDDFGLILTDKKIGLPKPRTSFVKIEGSSGMLDLSTALTGSMTYDNRVLEFTFKNRNAGKWKNNEELFFKEIHGQRMDIVVWDHPFDVFTGRCEIIDYTVNKSVGVLKVRVDADPFIFRPKNQRIVFTNSLNKTIVLNCKDVKNPTYKTNKPATVDIKTQVNENGDHVLVVTATGTGDIILDLGWMEGDV